MQFPCKSLWIKASAKCKCKCYIFFLSDSTTRPSDLPLNVIVQSGNSQAVRQKLCVGGESVFPLGSVLKPEVSI